MNAERFENKDYTDGIAQVDFKRICELEKGQDFLMNGIWWQVHSITKEKVYFFNKRTCKGRSNSLGAKSKMFVQVIKKIPS